MKTYAIYKWEDMYPTGDRYDAHNKTEALVAFKKDSEKIVAHLKEVQFTFELYGEKLFEFTDGELSGRYIAIEEDES